MASTLSSNRVRVPHRFQPRDYQVPIFRAFEQGYKRFLLIHHRRAGKDKTCFNAMIWQAVERVGQYYYILPTYAQGKRAIWEGIDRAGIRTLDHVPAMLRAAEPNNTEMLLRLTNGSIIQILGGLNVDRLVGTNPVGIVFSEYSLTNPVVWNMLRPILVENDGWAMFNGTPRGSNHFLDMYEMAQGNPEWFVSVKTVDDTGVLTEADIDSERRAGMSEELIRQEFYCSFEAANEGTYYGRLMNAARDDDPPRITRVPWEPALPVHTAWDLGVDDATAIWFWQQHRNERRFIDYEEHNGEGLPFYAKLLQSKPYVYGQHYGPHDIAVRELGTGKSRLETAAALGLRFTVVGAQRLEDQIEAVRSALPLSWFDAEKCKAGIAALRSYHKSYDEQRKVFRSHPEHDWSSHGASAFATGVLGQRPALTLPQPARQVFSFQR